jgi:hypothetical protein
MSNNNYSTFDVPVFVPFTNRPLIQSWIEKGFILPSVRADGLGTKSVFTFTDIKRIVIFQALFAAGLSGKEASQITYGLNIDDLSSDSRFLVLHRKLTGIKQCETSYSFIGFYDHLSKKILELSSASDLLIVIDVFQLLNRIGVCTS